MYDDDVIIRPADKGSGIVIMDKDKYIYLEGLHHEMEKSSSYIQTDTDETSGVTKKVKKLITKTQKEGTIDNDMKAYMCPRYSRAVRLKVNPKLHKENKSLRTIVSEQRELPR